VDILGRAAPRKLRSATSMSRSLRASTRRDPALRGFGLGSLCALRDVDVGGPCLVVY
jgi:hypothetical protein